MASLTRLQNVLVVGCPPSHAVHYASLIVNVPQTHVTCIIGLMASRPERAVTARSHLVWYRLFLAGSADELGHLLHGFAEEACLLFTDLSEG